MDEDFGKLVLRLTVGLLLLFHGVHHVLTGIDPIRNMITAQGWPGWLAYGIYVGEVLAPILVVLGVLTRVGGGLIVLDIILSVALAVVNKNVGPIALGPDGGYILELEALFLFSGLAVALLGAGRLSIGGIHGRWN